MIWARIVPFRLCSSWEKFMRIVKSVISWLRTRVRLPYFLVHSMEQYPSWDTTRFPAGLEIRRILWNSKFRYRIHKCSPPIPIPILIQIDPAYAPTSNLFKIYFKIFLPSTTWASELSLSLRFFHQNPVYNSPVPHTCHIPHPSHSSRFDHPNNIGWRVPIIKLLII
jgi:hypothetical protein